MPVDTVELVSGTALVVVGELAKWSESGPLTLDLCPSAEAEKSLILGIWHICSSALLVNTWISPLGEIVNSNISLELTFHQMVKLGNKVKICPNSIKLIE